MGSTGKDMKVEAVFPSNTPQFVQFASRRSVVHSTKGIVACTQPLAAEAGQRILKQGGNAADAAVAVAAALNMAEPTSTGIGGDMFCLYFDAKTKKVHALNGSGRSAKNTTLEQVRQELGISSGKIPTHSPLSVTVPGAPGGWVDTIEKFGSGKLSLEQILTPAIEMGEEGFPVSELAAMQWHDHEPDLRRASPNFREMLKRDKNSEDFVRAPRAGEIMRNPNLAKTFRTLAAEGKKGFYSGRIGQAIIDVLNLTGGHMELSDLEDHMNRGAQETEPISLKFSAQNVKNQGTHRVTNGSPDNHFVELWEHPPNGQGIVALMALGILEELERTHQIPAFAQEDHNSAIHLHAVIEALKIAFADASWWVTDPDFMKVKSSELISRPYLTERAKLFNKDKAGQFDSGQPGPSPAQNHSDTVYFAVTDKDGNGMSFINSNYEGFGSAIIPQGCGFTLQNRGSNFQLGPENHPNIYQGGKRPYHTIIPGLITHGEEADRQLHSVYGVMGGFMQPQGHVQVLLNMEVFGLNPQQALDAPRICIGAGMPKEGDTDGTVINVEEGIDEATVKALEQMGHNVQVLHGFRRAMFGRGQVIRRHVDEETGQMVFSGGSDPRGDGCALPG
ncbi:gamma-glutamyltranspeptidase [Cladophialophora yegresii CBS 114405]|uniref:Gamma-glutamyltranspeptidase n=1 Tax=Cladophialophora yegresii CBS 114405 TaxID=1182544 RepID=W9VVY9_9EURO|nr:gamma-glutamyltranspeptidase [Cladophialophora yegresii CBS 114405]EXJ60002.1 gamma-glutamyltranspeptidase [Cladophialophora yegresii CBS 114405]